MDFSSLGFFFFFRFVPSWRKWWSKRRTPSRNTFWNHFSCFFFNFDDFRLTYFFSWWLLFVPSYYWESLLWKLMLSSRDSTFTISLMFSASNYIVLNFDLLLQLLQQIISTLDLFLYSGCLKSGKGQNPNAILGWGVWISDNFCCLKSGPTCPDVKLDHFAYKIYV